MPLLSGSAVPFLKIPVRLTHIWNDKYLNNKVEIILYYQISHTQPKSCYKVFPGEKWSNISHTSDLQKYKKSDIKSCQVLATGMGNSNFQILLEGNV